MGQRQLRFQRRFLQARYSPAALVFEKGPTLAHALSDKYPQVTRQGDGSQWQLSCNPEFRRVSFSLTQVELNQEEHDDIGAFSRESERACNLVTKTLDVSTYVRLGLVQSVLVPGPAFDKCLVAFRDQLFKDNLAPTKAPLTWLSDTAVVLEFKDERWAGRVQFGPYNADTNKTLFEFRDAPSLKDFVGGFVFWCDFWKSSTFPLTEPSRFVTEATEHTTNMIEHIMGIVGGGLG